jgi:acyl-CoA dehydrogenase
VNLSLDAREERFREEVRAFLADKLTAETRSQQRKSAGVYPHPSVSRPWQRTLHERGWGAPLWPVEYGGTGWSPIERFIFEYECARAGAPLPHPIGTRLVGPVILRFGTQEQKAYYLPRIVSAEDYWCQGYSEPNAGSDLASLKTRAVRDGDLYVVNGSKIWTTHAHFADKMFMLVRTSSSARPQAGISFLLVDMNTPGISVRPILSMSGEHELNQVFFEDVKVPVSQRVGPEDEGWTCAKYLLEFERGGGMFSARMRASLDRVQEVIAAQAAEGMQVMNDPVAASRFAEVAAELDVFEMLELRIAGQLQAGQNPGPVASILKLRASRLKQEIGKLGIDLLSDVGLDLGALQDDPDALGVPTLVRDYLNSRATTIFGGASEIQLGLIAKALM